MLETSDAARVIGVTSSAIYRAADAGRLPIAALTLRGTRLFAPDDVEEYRRRRLARLARAVERATPVYLSLDPRAGVLGAVAGHSA